MPMRKINCFLCFFLPLWDNMGEYDTEKRDKLNNLPDLGMEWRRKRRGCVVWAFSSLSLGERGEVCFSCVLRRISFK